MHTNSAILAGIPSWQSGAEQRLRASMVVSAMVLAAALSLLRLPSPATIAPILQLVVELSRPRPVPEPVEVLPEHVTPDVEQAAAETEPVVQAAPAGEADEAIDDAGPLDWEPHRVAAIKAVLDAAEREANYSVNPPFERSRREASVRFRASLAPGAVNAWDRVEKDQLGRTILRLGDGNCFQVMDDPSGVNRWAFETFESKLVMCEFHFGGRQGTELPWVDIIRERYPYLRDPVAIP